MPLQPTLILGSSGQCEAMATPRDAMASFRVLGRVLACLLSHQVDCSEHALHKIGVAPLGEWRANFNRPRRAVVLHPLIIRSASWDPECSALTEASCIRGEQGVKRGEQIEESGNQEAASSEQ